MKYKTIYEYPASSSEFSEVLDDGKYKFMIFSRRKKVRKGEVIKLLEQMTWVDGCYRPTGRYVYCEIISAEIIPNTSFWNVNIRITNGVMEELK